VKWLVETIKSFKFSTLYRAIWEFLEGQIQDWKGGKQRKAQVRNMTKTYKNIRNNINCRVALAITWVKALYNDPFWGTFPFATKGIF
jgi:hypothetical protein